MLLSQSKLTIRDKNVGGVHAVLLTCDNWVLNNVDEWCGLASGLLDRLFCSRLSGWSETFWQVFHQSPEIVQTQQLATGDGL